MAKIVNLTRVKQTWDGITLHPGIETKVSDGLAAKLYGHPDYQVTFGTVKPLRDEQGWHVLWKSPFSVSDGYAVAGEHTLAALMGQGVDVLAQSCWFKHPEGLNRETVEKVDPIISKDAVGYQVGIMLAVPRYFDELPTPYRIGWTMWETTDPIVQGHPDWPELMSKINRLWVPTKWQEPVFGKFFKGPIQTVPLAINPRYAFVARPMRETFTVVAWGVMTDRKSPVETVDVFKRAFPRDKYPHCRLRIKTKLNIFGDPSRRDPKFIKDDRVEVYDGVWQVEDMIGFLYDADCALILPRGEGFGMPAREAMATGLPTILANHSGHIEVCDARYNWPIETHHTDRSSMGGDWWLPNWEQAADVLRWVHDNREASLVQAKAGAEWFEREWGQTAVGRKIVEALGEMERSGL